MNLQLNRRRSRIDMIPMIDVMFFMLVFFMLFSTINGAQTGVPVNLPKVFHLGNIVENTMVISITDDSRIYLGKQLLELNELKEQISKQLLNDPATRIIIRPDATVTYREIVRVMDTLASAGLERPLLGVDRQQIPNNQLRIEN